MCQVQTASMCQGPQRIKGLNVQRASMCQGPQYVIIELNKCGMGTAPWSVPLTASSSESDPSSASCASPALGPGRQAADPFQCSLYAPVCHTKQILQFRKSESRPFHKLTSQNRCDMVFLACGENLQRTRMFLHCRHGRLPLYLTIGHYFIYHHLIWYPILWLICTMRRTMSSEIVLFLHVQERPPDWKAF